MCIRDSFLSSSLSLFLSSSLYLFLSSSLSLFLSVSLPLFLSFSLPLFLSSSLPLFISSSQRSKTYECHFEYRGTAYATSTVTLISDSQLTCSVPLWPRAASAANVTLYCEQELVRMSAGVPTIWYVSSWTLFSPGLVDKTGGTMVTIRGHGFGDSSAWTQNSVDSMIDVAEQPVYTCRFSNGSLTVHVQARALSDTVVSCQAPTWSLVPWAMYNTAVDGRSNLTLLSRDSNSSDQKHVQTFNTDDIFFERLNKPPFVLGMHLDA
eukprot:3644797-Rhodomonas_salina.1